MLKAVIFDMDGVIVDTEYTYLEEKAAMLKDWGHDLGIEYQYQFMGTTYDFMWSTMIKELELPFTIEECIAEMNRRREAVIEKDGYLPIKHTAALIKRLKNRGLRLAVASSSPKEEIQKVLEALELVEYFELYVSGEECAHPKPAPDVFLKAALELGIEADECFVVEDSRNGVAAAKAAQMYCIGYANPDYATQDLSKADVIVTDMDEITNQVIDKLF